MKHLKVSPSQLHPRSWALMMAFQLCVEYKSRKHSFGLFFNLLHLRLPSQDNFHNQWLINIYQVKSWFNIFTQDLGDFLGCFLLVRSLTLEAHLTWCYLPTESSSLYRSSFPKYWSKIIFNIDVYSYRSKQGSLSSNEVEMNEDPNSWFQGLGYKERSGPSEVPLPR